MYVGNLWEKFPTLKELVTGISVNLIDLISISVNLVIVGFKTQPIVNTKYL